MKKTNLTDFDADVVASNDYFNIKSDDYLDSLTINKVVVLPLRHLQGNIDTKSGGKDQTILILSGTGKLEINGTGVPLTSGDIALIKKSEAFIITNDALNDVLQFVSVFNKK